LNKNRLKIPVNLTLTENFIYSKINNLPVSTCSYFSSSAPTKDASVAGISLRLINTLILRWIHAFVPSIQVGPKRRGMDLLPDPVRS